MANSGIIDEYSGPNENGYEFKRRTYRDAYKGPRLLFKDVEPKVKELGFKLEQYVPYESNYTLTNEYIKVNFVRLYEILEFLDWVKGEPKKRFIRVV